MSAVELRHLGGHKPCATEGTHTCSRPSGRRCVDCGRSAGTLWGPMWCVVCDEARLARIDRSFSEIQAAFS